jgi:hypothetical protein
MKSKLFIVLVFGIFSASAVAVMPDDAKKPAKPPKKEVKLQSSAGGSVASSLTPVDPDCKDVDQEVTGGKSKAVSGKVSTDEKSVKKAAE